jgi:hypothetical protein
VWEKIIATSAPRPCPKVRLGFIPSRKSLNGTFLDGAMVGAGSLRPILEGLSHFEIPQPGRLRESPKSGRLSIRKLHMHKEGIHF